MKFVRAAYLVFFFSGIMFASVASAQSLTVQRVATGLAAPTFATHAPGDADRLYITQRSGAIRILNLTTGNLNAGNFITVPSVNTSFEGGLLGLAFHPDFETNNFFYVNYTISAGGSFRTRVSRFTATNANSASSATEQVIIEVNQPQQNHNAGWIGFSPVDNFLYVSMGDGGGGNDSGAGHTANIGNGQDFTNNLLGSMLRLDINGDDFPADSLRNYAIPAGNPFVGVTGDDEIFLYGLRNPFRCSFDQNGDFYIGDVGQNAREEIDVIPADFTGDLNNLGWRFREGTIATPGVGAAQPANGMNPVYDYLHNFGDFGGVSVTGGVVYRGPIEALQGSYFFADFVSDNMWSFVYDGSDPASFNGTNFTNFVAWEDFVTISGGGDLDNIVAFGEDLAGNVYIVDLSDGELFQITGGSLGLPIDGTTDTITSVVGVTESGTVADLVASDDAAVRFRNSNVAPGDPALQVEFEAALPSASPSNLIMNFESRGSSPNLLQNLELFNFDSGTYESFDKRRLATDDASITFEVADPDRFISKSRARLRMTVSVDGPVVASPWAAIVDQVLFQVQ